jgi:hypothetical protein
MHSSVKQFVVNVQFCQAICGQCTVLSNNLWSMYSFVKQFVVNAQFCQAICGQCTVLSSSLWSMYNSVKQRVVNAQFCQATCGQYCWVTKVTDTHSRYAKFIAFPGQQFVRIRTSVLRYTYITLPVLFKTTSKKVVIWEGVMGQNHVSLPSKASVSNILCCNRYSVKQRPMNPQQNIKCPLFCRLEIEIWTARQYLVKIFNFIGPPYKNSDKQFMGLYCVTDRGTGKTSTQNQKNIITGTRQMTSRVDPSTRK